MLNNVTLIGNITHTPTVKEFADIRVCNYTIAVNDINGSTYYFDCKSWNAQADWVAEYCDKGSKVAVCGKLTQRSYDGKDGTKKTAVEIMVQSIEFLTKKEKKVEMEEVADDEDLPF